ncbi:L-lactate dehydrogenase complex protein LldG [Mucilaginibacter oryzae]|uniref:L-lactate dehydrogenase complex protein LldG n=1 Tax=Mucilaginibacter oryzae TaxID=468058 RepID=A0A316H9S9_9SPHI|nr:LUD domain-containing protein [Mucilaginibacter oryzae]PWK77804.1 L-lactate dehydrogenase complex protein LldG [Mucilaginibacter oryzae]
MSRDKILAAVKLNQPAALPLPDMDVLNNLTNVRTDLVTKYKTVATAGGTFVHEVNGFDKIKAILKQNFRPEVKIISALNEPSDYIYTDTVKFEDRHNFADVELTILRSNLGVAENGALWLTDKQIGSRVLPFIAQHLAVVIGKDDFVPTMAQAYQVIGDADYGYGSFISGPSKTADIEQSLVIGAHGPRSLSVFILS